MVDKKQIQTFLEQYAESFQDFLEQYLFPYIREGTVEQISGPLCYVLNAPAKRIRPALLFLCAGLAPKSSFAKDDKTYLVAYYVAVALELIHTYSLIHDDLPAMDNDDLRRGRPTCHIQYNEWTAILVGDALNTLAFELLAHAGEINSDLDLKKLVFILSKGAGISGIISGQALDLAAEKNELSKKQKKQSKEQLVDEIHLKKTAALFSVSCELGARIAFYKDMEPYREFGYKLGLLFQITDDLLDINGNEEIMGKASGKDQKKITYPNVFGIERSKRKCSILQGELHTLALNLEATSYNKLEYKKPFSELVDFVINRNS